MTKITRRALLMSVMSLFLCFAMLVGTTFAWFTDSVTSGNNIIKTGTLDVEMHWADGTKAVPALDSTDWTDASTGAIFDYDLWEPGYVEVRHIKIENRGNLALKYMVKVVANGDVDDLADAIDVYYVDPAVQVADRTALTEDAKLGTLAEALAGLGATGAGVLEAGDSDVITIALKMREDAGNEYKDKEIGASFAIQLIATQVESESDAFGTDYDADVEYPTVVSTAAELVAAMANGGNIVLDGDVDMGATGMSVTGDVVIDLNGHNITGNYQGTDHYALFSIANGASLTINGDGNVTTETKSEENNRSLALFLNDGNLTINGGTYHLDDASEGKTWIIATLVDNRTRSTSSHATLTINGGEFSVGGNAINLFRNYPQQGGTATLKITDGVFKANPGKTTTYIWNQEAGSYLGEMYFDGGVYDANVVYEDYNGQSDIHVAPGVTIQGYAGNN